MHALRLCLALFVPLFPLAASHATPPPQLQILEEGGVKRVVLLDGDTPLLASPEAGLWSVATDFEAGWPTAWRSAHPEAVEQAGDWTVLRGRIETPEGAWEVSDAYRPEKGLVKGVRRFTWRGEKPAKKSTLTVRFVSPGQGAGVLMPGILYHGNPSGAKSGRTPVYTGQPGEEALYEEHRFPMPFVSLEWEGAGAWRGAALHSLPSPLPFGHVPDQWWSLGAIAREAGTELVIYSGPCASNGKRNVIKAVQPGFVPYGECSLEVPPGGIIEKTFWLQGYPVVREGAGFQAAAAAALRIFTPFELTGLPSFSEILTAKYRYAQGRWYENENAAGFHKFYNRPFFVFGWCGQAAAPGYAFQVLAEGLPEGPALKQAQQSLDFLSTAAFFEGGFHTWYNHEKKEWSKDEPLSQGQGMLCFANAIRVGREAGRATAKWEAFLKKAAAFHADRILKDNWRPKSTDEGFFIAPLCIAAGLFDQPRLLEAAVKAGAHYAERHLSMREPYWGGTLDASCEDKEGAFAACQGFLALYKATQEANYLDWAQHACDCMLTYTVIWDIDLPAGRLRDHAFKTRGWTAVSPQNQHIDVYGVLIAPYVYELGQLTDREEWRALALVMYRSCGQLIDPYGSQGEQPQQTNYAQRGEVKDIFALRGGYAEDWTVFWITAHFLQAGALFKELGVNVWEE